MYDGYNVSPMQLYGSMQHNSVKDTKRLTGYFWNVCLLSHHGSFVDVCYRHAVWFIVTCCYITLQKPLPLTESGPLTYIDKPEQLECLLDDLLDVTEIAVDLEVF